MATKTVKVSDLTANEIPEEQQDVRLIVEHPDFDEPIGLEVLPQEIEGQLPQTQEYVAFSYGTTQTQRYLMPREEFNRLFPNGNADAILQRVHAEQEELRQQTAQRGRRRQQTRGTRPRVDYTSPEHAGEPHRGTISEAEAEYVQNNLAEVNRRRREQGYPELDPTNPRTAARYGFPPPGADEPDEV